MAIRKITILKTNIAKPDDIFAQNELKYEFETFHAIILF